MDPGFYRFFRSITPSGFLKWIDRYDYEAAELQDLIQTAPAPIQVQTLDCTVAQTIQLEFKYPARAFVIYFYDSTTTTKTVKPNGYVKVRINENRAENEFPAKHNRGYRGDYYRLYLTWPAQANTKADLVMHMFDDDPWQMDGIQAASTGLIQINAFNNEALTGVVDGANKDFTMTNTPVSEASVLVFANAQMIYNVDYTVNLATKTVSFTVAPALLTVPRVYYPS